MQAMDETPGTRRPGLKAVHRPSGQRVRRATEWGKGKYAGSWAEYLWGRLDAFDFMNQAMLLAATLLLCAVLSHTDGLYFTVTVFSTVGFGDITAKTQLARLVVTGQMIADLIILGLAIKIIVGAVKRGQQRQGRPGQHPDPG